MVFDWIWYARCGLDTHCGLVQYCIWHREINNRSESWSRTLYIQYTVYNLYSIYARNIPNGSPSMVFFFFLKKSIIGIKLALIWFKKIVRQRYKYYTVLCMYSCIWSVRLMIPIVKIVINSINSIILWSYFRCSHSTSKYMIQS